MDKVKFSFVIPVYNVIDYLERCVDSVLQQDYENLEIILVDDGSSDGSEILCNDYAQKYDKITVIHKENGGLSSARNMGMEHAKGTYILFLDSDDYVDMQMCSRIDYALKAYPVADVISYDGWEVIGAQKESMRRIPVETTRSLGGEDFLIERYQQRNLNAEACLYGFRREFLEREKLWFVEGILHEDVEFTPRVLEKAKVVLEIPDKLYCYIIRENSISTRRNKERNIRDLFHTLKCMEERATHMENQELGRWTRDAVLNSYLNMVQEARMYLPEYRDLVDKNFLKGKAATGRNQLRVLLCMISIRLYCMVNDWSKKVR